MLTSPAIITYVQPSIFKFLDLEIHNNIENYVDITIYLLLPSCHGNDKKNCCTFHSTPLWTVFQLDVCTVHVMTTIIKDTVRSVANNCLKWRHFAVIETLFVANSPPTAWCTWPRSGRHQIHRWDGDPVHSCHKCWRQLPWPYLLSSLQLLPLLWNPSLVKFCPFNQVQLIIVH